MDSETTSVQSNSPTSLVIEAKPELIPADPQETFIDAHGSKRYKVTGRLCKGYTANPLGAPPKRFVSSQLKKLLETGNDKKIARRLMKIAVNSLNERNATYAAEVIMDRTEGKPMQSLKIEQTVDEAAARRMVDLAERLAAIAQK